MDTNPTDGNPVNPETGTPVYPNTTQLPRLRTYADDLSEEMRKKGATLSSIVGAERERDARRSAEVGLGIVSEDQTIGTNTEESSARTNRNVFLILAIALLIILGGGAIAVSYLFSGPSEEVATDAPLIAPNKHIAVTQTERDLSETLLGVRQNASLSLGEVAMLDIALTTTTTPAALLAAFDAPAPIIRETQEMMIGLHSFNHYQPFIILRIDQYDRAFAAMLDWEEEMGRGLGVFFRPLNGTVPPTTQFTDFVYKNIDVRKSQDAWPIWYAFPRRDILVITTNESTLNEVVTRLGASR